MYNEKRAVYVSVLRGAAIFLWTLIIKLITMLVVYAIGSAKESFLRNLPNALLHGVVIAAGFFIYNSVLRLLTLFDKTAREEYLSEYGGVFIFSAEIKKVFTSRDFWIESITALLMFAAAAMMGAYPDIGGIILGDGSIGTTLCNGISAAILIPTLFVIGIFNRYEVRRYWIELDRRQDTEKIEKPFQFFIRALFISIAYPLVFPLSPLLLFVFYSMFNILFSIVDALSIIGTAVAIVLLVLIIYVFPLLRGMNKRRKFIADMRRVCERCGYTVSHIKEPYKSFTRPKIGANFSIEKDGREYQCAFVSTLHRGTWLSFVSDTDAYFRHRIGTKNHHFTVNHHIEYGIRGEGRKCIIISPLPKRIFAESDGSSREILPGDKIWGYTIYNMSGFINAIDRDCLDRSNRFD